jgi:Putative zinc-finger
MPEVPKIVRDRLRAGLPGGTGPDASHPDPDVLTAFAERALSAADREAVLQHLARCGDCRELVALSIPPMESSAQPVAEEESESSVLAADAADGEAGGQRFWFAWPGLRWAALAAGIAVAGGILLVHPGKQNAVREAKQQPASTVTQPEKTIVANKALPAPTAEANNTEKKAAARGFSRDKESKPAYPAAAPAAKVMARGEIETRAADKDLAASASPASPAPAPPARPSAYAFEVSGAATAVKTEEARNDISMGGMRAAAPIIISKAKAAKGESNEPSALQRSENLDAKQATTDTAAQQQRVVAGAGMVASNLRPNGNETDSLQLAQFPAQWAVHGNELQRSVDAGGAWKAVLHSDRPLLCYAASGNDVWAGGEGGNLFHSANGGLTWSQVHPSAQQQTLSDDVTHIEIHSPSRVAVFTSNHQSWSTTDGGRSWQKK